MSIIAFDVDGTLETYDEKPRWDVIDLMRLFNKLGHTVIVWSGGGKEYAKHKVQQLNLQEIVSECYRKNEPGVLADIAFDDEVVNLGEANIQV